MLIDESPAELSQESLHEESSSVSSVPSRLPVEAEKSITRLICIRWRSFGMYQGTQTRLLAAKGPLGATSVRCTPMRCTPRELHAHEIDAREMHAHEVHAHKMHARKIYAHKMQAHPIRRQM